MPHAGVSGTPLLQGCVAQVQRCVTEGVETCPQTRGCRGCPDALLIRVVPLKSRASVRSCSSPSGHGPGQARSVMDFPRRGSNTVPVTIRRHVSGRQSRPVYKAGTGIAPATGSIDQPSFRSVVHVQKDESLRRCAAGPRQRRRGHVPARDGAGSPAHRGHGFAHQACGCRRRVAGHGHQP